MSMIRKHRKTTVSGTYANGSTGIAAGTTTGGTSLFSGRVAPGSLSCLWTVLAETSTLTLTPLWQVSHDATTWYTATDSAGVTPLPIATGTTAADAAVSVMIEAPTSVMGWEYVRPAVTTGVTTGVTADTYSMTVCYVPADDPGTVPW